MPVSQLEQCQRTVPTAGEREQCCTMQWAVKVKTSENVTLKNGAISGCLLLSHDVSVALMTRFLVAAVMVEKASREVGEMAGTGAAAQWRGLVLGARTIVAPWGIRSYSSGDSGCLGS